MINTKIYPQIRLVLLALAILGMSACYNRGPAEVKQVVSSPSGALHAAKLFRYGGATVGTRVIVSIFRGQAPHVGDTVNVEDQCFVFSGYKTGPWKMTWEGESQIALAIAGDRAYEKMTEEHTCYGVSPRSFYERQPAN